MNEKKLSAAIALVKYRVGDPTVRQGAWRLEGGSLARKRHPP